MTDIHCHILPGIDDGPSDIQESVEMARIAEADGIKTIVATPHIISKALTFDLIKERVELLNTFLRKKGIGIEILPGADVSLMNTLDFIMQYRLNETRYILVELPEHLSRPVRQNLFDLVMKDVTPIISHPERTPSLLKGSLTVKEIVDSGCLVQITAESLTGAFGEDARSFSIYLLKKGYVHLIASDAHGTKRRRPVLSRAFKIAERIIGREKALRLVLYNPEAIIRGMPLS